MSTQTYANAIEAERVNLAANLTTKGVSSVGTEPLDDLVAKVLTISTESTLTGDALVGEVLGGKLFYSDDPTTQLTGTMPDNSTDNVEVTDIDGTLIPEGYYNGTGSALLSAAEAAKVIAGNIKDGVTILGVLGTLSGASVLTGDAVVAEVLAGKTFYSNDAGTQLTGTMPDNEGDNASTSSSVTGTTLKLVAPTGFYDGTDTVTITDADFIAANIKSGVDLFGVTGTAVIPTIDSYTKVLLHFDGANNGTTFTDESGKTWTASGDAKTITHVGGVGGSAIGSFDGTGDYISTADHDDFDFGTGDFTIDFWVIATNVVDSYDTFISQYQDASNRWVFSAGPTAQSLNLFCAVNGTTTCNISWGSVNLTKWLHIALVRENGAFKAYGNGVLLPPSVFTDLGANAMPNITGNITIAARNIGSIDRDISAHFEEFRISKGIARWTAQFIPASPYPS